MTLVVGRVVQGKTYIFADTALTSSTGQRINPFTEGCLKCYIVNERVALAFADAMPAFEQTCGTLLSMSEACEIAQYAANAQTNGWPVELLIAEAGRDMLWIVKNGTIVESSAGFLGDAQAFNAYQQHFNAPSSIPTEQPANTFQIKLLRLPEPVLVDDIYGRMFDSFKAVIENAAFPTVGGAILPLCTHNGLFQYFHYAAVFSPFDHTMLNGKPVPFGTAVNGGYAVELCTDEECSEPGVYFLQGGFGLFFLREDSGFRRAKVVQARNPAYFAMESNKSLGRQLKSCYMTPDHCGIAGESFYEAGRYEDALFCYELCSGHRTLLNRPLIRDRYMGQFAAALYQCGQLDRALAILQECIAEQPAESQFCQHIRGQIIVTTLQATRSAP